MTNKYGIFHKAFLNKKTQTINQKVLAKISFQSYRKNSTQCSITLNDSLPFETPYLRLLVKVNKSHKIFSSSYHLEKNVFSTFLFTKVLFMSLVGYDKIAILLDIFDDIENTL